MAVHDLPFLASLFSVPFSAVVREGHPACYKACFNLPRDTVQDEPENWTVFESL